MASKRTRGRGDVETGPDAAGGGHSGFERLEARVLLAGNTLRAETAAMSWYGHTAEVVRDAWVITLEQPLTGGQLQAKTRQFLDALGVPSAQRITPIGRAGYARVITPERISEDAIASARRQVGGVLGFQPDFVYQPTRVPNDTDTGQQYAIANVGQDIPGLGPGTPGADIDALTAWDTTIGSRDVVIAVIDTGVDLQHPDLVANIWVNPGEISGNGVDDDGNGFIDDINGYDFGDGDSNPDDVYGHGTAVAGCIGASGNNALGVTGVNWSVSILAVKIADRFGLLSTAAVVASHDYLTDLIANRGINVVASNNSYGAFAPAFYEDFDGGLQAERAAIERFVATGATFVASAGNESNDNDAVFTSFPAAYDIPELVSVAATDNRDGLAGFSSYGLRSVDLGAPGVQTLTTANGGGYVYISGTSFSGPYTAGVVGLLKAHKPNASQEEVKRALLTGVDFTPSLQGRTVSGGRLNAAKALRIIDIEGPVVTRVTPGPVTISTSTVSVSFSDPIQSVTFTGTGAIQLRRAGGDGSFGSGNETALTPVSAALDSARTTATFGFAAPFAVDNYQLTILEGAFRDDTGNRLNGNTAAGQDEAYAFEVVNVTGGFEPNETLATATPVVFSVSGEAVISSSTIGDGINGALDVDLYQFDLPGPGLVTAQVDARNRGIPSTLDSYLRLFNARGEELGANDNFNGLDSRVQFFVANGGRYYVGVSGFPNTRYQPTVSGSGVNQSTGDYDLRMRVDVVETEARSFNSTTTPRPIPQIGIVEDTIEITDTREIVDLNLRLDATHPFDADLRFTLVAPDGTETLLVNGRGGSGDNFRQTVLDDEAAAAIVAGSAPFTGAFRPDNPLNRVDGRSALGTWTLRVEDTTPLNVGTLDGWGLDVTFGNNISGPFELNDVVATATDAGLSGSGARQFDGVIGDGAFGRRDVDLFRFSAGAGTTISLRAAPVPGADGQQTALDLALRLFDADGREVLADDPAGSTDARINFTTERAGTFYAAVSGGGNIAYDPFNGGSGTPSGATGPFSLQVSVTGGISNGPVLLDGQRIDAGIAANGVLDTTATLGAGLRYRGIEFAAVGSGSPESFLGASAGGYIFSNAGSGRIDLPLTIATESDFSNERVVATGAARGLLVRRTLAYGIADNAIAIDVVLTNGTASTIEGVSWMEGLNPEHPLSLRGLNGRTVNDVNGRVVLGSYANNEFPGGLTIALAAPSSDTRAIGSVETPGTVRDPAQIIDSPVDPDPAGTGSVTPDDGTLALAFNVGSLGAGASARLRYFIIFGDSRAEALAAYTTIDTGQGSGHLVLNPDDPALDPERLPYRLYYPEGYSNRTSSEFVPITNPNPYPARVVVIARYETGERDQVLFDDVIEASTRTGITLSTPALAAAGQSLVRLDTPFSLEIAASQPVSATLSHYDFSISTGQSFTSATSATWTFGEGYRGPGVSDFVVFYNPGEQTIRATLTLFPQDASQPATVLTQVVAGKRRAGWNLANEPGVPTGAFGVLLTTDAPVAAALTHYDTNLGGGFSALGEPGLGRTAGATAEGQLGINAEDEFLTVLNAGVEPANVTFTFVFENGSAFREQISVPGGRRGGFNIRDVRGFPIGEQAYAVTYTSDQPVAVSTTTYGLTFGGATGSSFGGDGYSTWLFSEGFRPAGGAGTVIEYLRLYNPSERDISVQVTLLYSDGTSETFLRTASSRAPENFDVHAFVAGSRTASDAFYSVRVTAPIPILAYMGHFDTFLGGGFGTPGTGLGVTAPIT